MVPGVDEDLLKSDTMTLTSRQRYLVTMEQSLVTSLTISGVLSELLSELISISLVTPRMKLSPLFIDILTFHLKTKDN